MKNIQIFIIIIFASCNTNIEETGTNETANRLKINNSTIVQPLISKPIDEILEKYMNEENQFYTRNGCKTIYKIIFNRNNSDTTSLYITTKASVIVNEYEPYSIVSAFWHKDFLITICDYINDSSNICYYQRVKIEDSIHQYISDYLHTNSNEKNILTYKCEIVGDKIVNIEEELW